MSPIRILLLLLAALLLAPAAASAQDPQAILNSFADEPDILQVQGAAMIYAGLDPGMIDGWYTRANVSKIMPDRAEYRLSIRETDRETNRFTEDLNANGDTLGRELRDEERVEARLEHRINVQWNLSELIFNPDLLKISREGNRQAKVREDILSAVTKLYYERRRSQVDFKINPPGDISERLRAELQIQELTAEIDALTGGWFSSQLRANGLNPY